MIIYGKNAVKEAILANRNIHELWIDGQLKDQQFLYFLKDRNIKYQEASKDLLNQKSKNGLHQGVLAYVDEYTYHTLEDVIDEKILQRFLILDELSDPHNLGAILRTAEATKIDGVIMSKKHQVPITPTVVKISSGGIEHVPLVLVGNINQAIAHFQSKGVLVVGADGNTDQTIKAVPKNCSVAFVLGNEGVGLRPLVKKSCDLIVKIPMYGKVNSLNVSVAAAVIMYLSLDL